MCRRSRQAELGGAIGLPTLHVSRTPQELRGGGLIGLAGGSLLVIDRDGLRRAGGFASAYFHLEIPEAT